MGREVHNLSARDGSSSSSSSGDSEGTEVWTEACCTGEKFKAFITDLGTLAILGFLCALVTFGCNVAHLVDEDQQNKTNFDHDRLSYALIGFSLVVLILVFIGNETIKMLILLYLVATAASGLGYAVNAGYDKSNVVDIDNTPIMQAAVAFAVFSVFVYSFMIWKQANHMFKNITLKHGLTLICAIITVLTISVWWSSDGSKLNIETVTNKGAVLGANDCNDDSQGWTSIVLTLGSIGCGLAVISFFFLNDEKVYLYGSITGFVLYAVFFVSQAIVNDKLYTSPNPENRAATSVPVIVCIIFAALNSVVLAGMIYLTVKVKDGPGVNPKKILSPDQFLLTGILLCASVAFALDRSATCTDHWFEYLLSIGLGCMVIVFIFTFLHVDIVVQLVHFVLAAVTFVVYFIAACVHYAGGMTSHQTTQLSQQQTCALVFTAIMIALMGIYYFMKFKGIGRVAA